MLVSVLVRSYRRPGPLLEVVERLRAQDYAPFEIVVVEQSGDAALVARLEALGDDRLRVVVRGPLGAPGARNEAIRHARGELLLLIDDDDLPIGTGWIAAHVANYADPLCQGVVGRLTSDPAGGGLSRRPRVTRWRALRHTFWKDTWGFTNGPLAKRDVDFLIGSNASVRRSLVDRIGGWDEGVSFGEEQSFAYRYHRGRAPGEYLAYDPTPVIQRRLDVPGGLERRTGDDWYRQELAGRVTFYHHLVGHYFPWRFRLLYPFYQLRTAWHVWEWIWDGDNRARGTWARLRATAGVLALLPRAVWRSRRGRAAVRRMYAINPAPRSEAEADVDP